MIVIKESAIGNITVCENINIGTNTHTATILVIILFNIVTPRLYSAKSAFSSLEHLYDVINVISGKVGPEFIGKIELGISRLP